MSLSCYDDVALANDAESTKNDNYVIMASLKRETMGKLINQVYQAWLR